MTTKIMEVKHQIRQPLSVRTRALGTMVEGNNPAIKSVFVAKGGVSPPPDCEDHNRYFVDLVLNRTADTRCTTRPFQPVREQWLTMSDVFQKTREIKANLEYDFKRRPISARMVEAVDGSDVTHLAFDTAPWKSLDEYDQARAYFQDWRGQQRCLKTLADWEDWEDYYLCKVALERVSKGSGNKRSKVQVTVDGSRGILKRMFLRAYVQGAWELKRTKTNADVSEMLDNMFSPVPVSVDDLKNGNKGEPLSNMVPRTPRTESLVKDLMFAFPGFDVSQVFIAEPVDDE